MEQFRMDSNSCFIKYQPIDTLYRDLSIISLIVLSVVQHAHNMHNIIYI